MIITEALNALWSLGAALLIWLAILATAAVLALEALTVGLYTAARYAWRALTGQTPYLPFTRRTHQKKPSDQTTAHTAAATTAPSHDSPDTKRQNSSITTNPATSPAPFRTHLMPANYPRTDAR
ncbi:hypothetical protein ACFW6Q_15070 [Streptomyces sp. NPDC058737]|uniref:hypothetical protein n=1 Tax=Streptomyces sp. NPDC058737 TaxID=3346617 RepID=UPI0036C3D0C3